MAEQTCVNCDAPLGCTHSLERLVELEQQLAAALEERDEYHDKWDGCIAQMNLNAETRLAMDIKIHKLETDLRTSLEQDRDALAERVRVLEELLAAVRTGVTANDSLEEYPCDHLRYGITKGRSKCFGCALHKRIKRALAAARAEINDLLPRMDADAFMLTQVGKDRDALAERVRVLDAIIVAYRHWRLVRKTSTMLNDDWAAHDEMVALIEAAAQPEGTDAPCPHCGEVCGDRGQGHLIGRPPDYGCERKPDGTDPARGRDD